MVRVLSIVVALVLVFTAGAIFAQGRAALNRFQSGPVSGVYSGDTQLPGLQVIPVQDTLGGTCALIYAYNGAPFSAVPANEEGCR